MFVADLVHNAKTLYAKKTTTTKQSALNVNCSGDDTRADADADAESNDRTIKQRKAINLE